MLSDSQSQQIKQQLIQQIQKTLPLAQQQQTIQEIQAMTNEQLEQFLIQNNLIKDAPEGAGGLGAGGGPTQQQCIFCAIVNNQIPSYKIDENSDSIAVLEINPISKAHILVIPKKHISEEKKIPKTAFTLAEKISKKIKTKFKPKDIIIVPSVVMDHAILNVLPIYENETIESKRKKAEQPELEKLQKKLAVKKKIPKVKKPKPIKLKENIKLPKRIP